MIATDGRGDLRGDMGVILDQWTEKIVPAEVRLLSNHHYSPRYAWMYSYEKQLKKRFEGALGHPLGHNIERTLFGADGVLSEALSNAFLHGHGRDPRQPITVSCAISGSLIWVSVQDQGPGFDVDTLVAKMRRSGSFFHVAGNGLRALDSSPGVVARFDCGGREIQMLIEINHPGKA